MNNLNGLKKNNIIFNIFSFLLIGSYLKNLKRCLWSKRKINYFISNSIVFNLYKKNLNKNDVSYILSSINNNNLKLSYIPNAKRHINFGKLTWYWVFRTITQNRFLLHYKEHKQYYSDFNFIKYEVDLLNYEKNYNKWNKLVNKYIKSSEENLFSTKMSRVIKKLYLFRLKVNKVQKLSKQTINKKILYLTNEKLIHKDNYLRYYRKPYVRKTYFGGIYKKYWKSKKFRITGLNQWRKSIVIKNQLIENKKKKNLLVFNFTKSIFNIIQKNNNYKKNLWNFKSSKNKYFKNISNSFTRKNIINNPIKINGIFSNTNSIKNNNNKMLRPWTSYIFPNNSVDLSRKHDFNSILFSKNDKNKEFNEINKYNFPLARNKNLMYKSINVKFHSFLKNKKKNIKLLLKQKNKKFLKKNNLNNLKLLNFNQNFNLNKNVESVRNSLIGRIKLQKNFKKNIYKKNNISAVVLGKGKSLIKKNKIFLSFIYNSKIKLKFIIIKRISDMLIFKFELNKKKLNQLITNLFYNNFSIRFYFKIHKNKLISSYSRNVRNKYIKFLLNLNKFNAMRFLKRKTNSIKKKSLKEQSIWVLKKKRLDKFKKEYSWSGAGMVGYDEAIKQKKGELLNEKKRKIKLKIIYNNKYGENQIRIAKKTIMRFGHRNFKRFSVLSNKNSFKPILGFGNVKRKNFLIMDKKYRKINILFLLKLKNNLSKILKINSNLNVKNYNKFKFFYLIAKIKKKKNFDDYVKFVNFYFKKKIKMGVINTFKYNKKKNNSINFIELYNKNFFKIKKLRLRNSRKFLKNSELKMKKINRKKSIFNFSSFVYTFKNSELLKWHSLNKKIKKDKEITKIKKTKNLKKLVLKKINNLKKKNVKKWNLFFFYNMSNYYKKKNTLNCYKKNKIWKKRITKLYFKNKKKYIKKSEFKLEFNRLTNLYKIQSSKYDFNSKKKKELFNSANNNLKFFFFIKKKKYKLLKKYNVTSIYLNKYKSIKNRKKGKYIKNGVLKIKKIMKKIKNVTGGSVLSDVNINRDFFFFFSIFEKIENNKKILILKKKKLKNYNILKQIPYFLKKNKTKNLFLRNKFFYNFFSYINKKTQKNHGVLYNKINFFCPISIYSNKFKIKKNYSKKKIKDGIFINNLTKNKLYLKNNQLGISESKKFPVNLKKKKLKLFSFYKGDINIVIYQKLKLFNNFKTKKYIKKKEIKYPLIKFFKYKTRNIISCKSLSNLKIKKNKEKKQYCWFLFKKNYIKKNSISLKINKINKKSTNMEYFKNLVILNNIFKKKNMSKQTNKQIYRSIIDSYINLGYYRGLSSLKIKLKKIKKKNVLKIFNNKKIIIKKYENNNMVNFLKDKVKDTFYKKKYSTLYNLNILLKFKEIFKYRSEYIKIKKIILKIKKKDKKNIDLYNFKNYKISKLLSSDRLLYLRFNKEKKTLNKISKIRKYNFICKSKQKRYLIKKKSLYFKKLSLSIKNSYKFLKKKKSIQFLKWSVFKKLKNINQIKIKRMWNIINNSKNKKIKSLNRNIRNLKNNSIKKNIKINLKFELDPFLKKIEKDNKLNDFSGLSINKIKKSKKKIRKKVVGLVEKLSKSLFINENKKKEKVILKKKYKFLGYRYLKKNKIVKRLRLKKINLSYKNINVMNKKKRKFMLNLKIWTIFYKKIIKNFKISIISKKNKHIWRKRLFPVTKILKKKLYDLKSKNRLTNKRWRAYGKRWLPKKWYRVRRRKFPLKSQKKDWALKITKHYNLFYWRTVKRYTIYDSSFSYYRFLSVRGKQSKNKKINLKKKLKGRVEHLIYYPWKFKPNFSYQKQFKKKTGIKYFTSRRVWRLNLYKKNSLNSLKTFYTPSSEDKYNKKQKTNNYTNNKIQDYYSKSFGIYATNRYSLYSIYLNKWQNKINKNISRGIFWYKNIESIKKYNDNDFENSINKSKQRKFTYLSKISGFYFNFDKQFLIKSLMYKNTQIFKNKLSIVYNISKKRKILRKGLFKIKLLYNLRRKIFGSGYVSLKQEISSLDFVSIKLKNFYKLNRFYFYKNVNLENFGYLNSKQKNFNFIEISPQKNIKFKHQIQPYLKKNKWLLNSFEVRGSVLLNSGKNI